MTTSSAGRHDHAAHYGHGHTHRASSEQRLLLALVLTAGFMVVEAASGFLSGSLALLADAAHMLTDAGALGLAYAGARLASRPPDKHRTYGYHRLEVLAAFVNGLALLLVVIGIAIEAVRRLFAPVEVVAGTMMTVAVIGLVVNLVCLGVLRGGDHHHHNLNLSSAAMHVMSDLLGSVATIVAAALVLWAGLAIADPLLSLIVSGMVLRSGITIVRRAGHVLLEGTPSGVDAERLRKDLAGAVPGLADIHHVHVWSLTDERPLVTLHARLVDGVDPGAVLDAVKRRLAEDGMAHSVIQLERGDCPDERHPC
jgi:cobalt-zinc-cadmium efflux system protein